MLPTTAGGGGGGGGGGGRQGGLPGISGSGRHRPIGMPGLGDSSAGGFSGGHSGLGGVGGSAGLGMGGGDIGRRGRGLGLGGGFGGGAVGAFGGGGESLGGLFPPTHTGPWAAGMGEDEQISAAVLAGGQVGSASLAAASRSTCSLPFARSHSHAVHSVWSATFLLG